MEVAFASRRLQKICEDPREARRRLGQASARKPQARLADIVAASRLGDIPAGQPHPLTGSRAGEFAVRLSAGHRLVFESNDDPVPTTDEGATDWKQVASIRIVFIGDYHD